MTVTGIDTNAAPAVRQSPRKRMRMKPVRRTDCQIELKPSATEACTKSPSSRTQSRRIPSGSVRETSANVSRTRSTVLRAFASPRLVILRSTAGRPS